jgi:hypothetical protein
MLNNWLTWRTIRDYIIQSNLIVDKPRLATTGWVDGTLTSDGRPNFIRVRFTDDKSEQEVYNDGVPIAYGLQIYVYKGFDGVYRARHPANSYYTDDLGFSFVKNHGSNHDFYGIDPTLFNVRSLLPMHPYFSGTWDVRVRPGWIVFNGRPYWFAGETLAVKTYRPSSGARFILLSAALADVSGVITVKIIVTSGTAKDNLVAPDDFPLVPDGHFPVCAVRVSSIRKKLTDSSYDGDLHDLRLSGGGPGGGHDIAGATHTSSATPGQILQANENGLPVDSPSTAADLARTIDLAYNYHVEPILFNGELLIFNNDLVMMEVKN